LSPSPAQSGRVASISVQAALAQRHCECFCGKLKKKETTSIDLARKYLLPNLKTTDLHGVLNVIDHSTQSSNPDLPVVVCVGINYTQFDEDGSIQCTSLVEDTTMRPHVIAAAAAIGKTSSACPLPEGFHLVATNYFPWITSKRWSDLKLNSIEEALLLRCYGDSDPTKRVADLVQEVNAHSVFFHGANNCVPALALSTVRFLSSWERPQNVVLCDNLSRPFGARNSVRLCECPISEAHVSSVVE
jgi:hypothetical protein